MSYYPGGPTPNQSSYPGGPQSSYPGGYQSSYPGGPQSSYPGGPQSSYPGSGGYQTAQSSHGGAPDYNSSSNYGPPPNASQSSYGPPPNASQSSYGSPSPSPYSNAPAQHQGPMQYDAQGNPIDGERGIGTMAAGAAAGWAGNKMTGGHMGGFSSMASGAILAQVGKTVFEKMNDKNKHGNGGYGGNPYGPPGGHHGGKPGGFGGFFK